MLSENESGSQGVGSRDPQVGDFVNEKDKQALFSVSLTNNGQSVILMTQRLDFFITHLKYIIEI